MLIELIGPAGCGKTTAAAHIDRLLRDRQPALLSFETLEQLNLTAGERYIEDLPRRSRLRLLAPLFLRHPTVAIPIMVLALLHGPRYKPRFRRAWRCLSHFHLVLRIQHLMPGSVVVLHEGFTQTLWTMLIDSKSLRGAWLIRLALSGYHSAVGQRGVQFWINDQTTTARVFGRESLGRFSRRSGEEQRRSFARWLVYHRRLVALMPERVIAVTIDASAPEQEVARAVADAVVDLADTAPELSLPTRAEARAGAVVRVEDRSSG